MRKELPKRLKNCVFNTEGDCSECPYQNSYTYCMEDLITKAADDICEAAKKLHAIERKKKDV